MEPSWVIGLIANCDKFKYKVVHTSSYLFGNVLEKRQRNNRKLLLLIKAIKNHLQGF